MRNRPYPVLKSQVLKNQHLGLQRDLGLMRKNIFRDHVLALLISSPALVCQGRGLAQFAFMCISH